MRERLSQPLMTPDKGGSEGGEEKHIPYSEAESISGGAAILKKAYSQQQWHDQVNEDLSHVDPKIRETLYGNKSGLPGRICQHLLRLLARRGVEYQFGIALLTHGSEFLSKFYSKKDEDHENRKYAWEVNSLVSAEWSDTIAWWTFAPHIYDELLKRGNSERDAMKKVLDWAQKASALEKFGSEPEYHLAGLEPFNEHHVDRYTLHPDPTHISHRFTRQEAKRIVRDVFGVEETRLHHEHNFPLDHNLGKPEEWSMDDFRKYIGKTVLVLDAHTGELVLRGKIVSTTDPYRYFSEIIEPHPEKGFDYAIRALKIPSSPEQFREEMAMYRFRVEE